MSKTKKKTKKLIKKLETSSLHQKFLTQLQSVLDEEYRWKMEFSKTEMTPEEKDQWTADTLRSMLTNGLN